MASLHAVPGDFANQSFRDCYGVFVPGGSRSACPSERELGRPNDWIGVRTPGFPPYESSHDW